MPTPAPSGDLHTFSRESFAHARDSFPIYRKGAGPAVVVLTEMPGITPQVLGFADRLVALGCTVVLPDLFGIAGRDPTAMPKWRAGLYTLRSVASVCVRREFNLFAHGKSSPIVDALRALARAEHQRCGGPGVGVIGMCFTGGFALAIAVEPCVLAPVLSQPSLPGALSAAARRSIDCSDADLTQVASRCAREDLQVLGVRFKGDPASPGARFQFLRERLGDAFVAVELDQKAGNPHELLRPHHSVLTGALIDEPGQPTRAALDQVLTLFRNKLLTA